MYIYKFSVWIYHAVKEQNKYTTTKLTPLKAVLLGSVLGPIIDAYIFKDLLNQSGNSASVRLSMEDFYNTAKDADFLIYNATIENPVKNIDQLCGRSALLADFKAVQEGNVWQVQRSLYQSPDIAAMMITDLHRMLTGKDTEEMTFLEQLK